MSTLTLPGFTGLSSQPEWLEERIRLADRKPEDEETGPEEDSRTLALLSALVRAYLEAVQALEGTQ